MWQTLSTPEFTPFLAEVYGLYTDLGIEEKATANPIHGRVKILPRLDLTGITRVPISERDRDRFEVSWKIALPVLEKKFQASGILQLIPIDSGRCRLVLKGRVQIRFFGVGRVLERKVVKSVKREAERFHRVIGRWKSKLI